jgi:hypothetical protein
VTVRVVKEGSFANERGQGKELHLASGIVVRRYASVKRSEAELEAESLARAAMVAVRAKRVRAGELLRELNRGSIGQPEQKEMLGLLAELAGISEAKQ